MGTANISIENLYTQDRETNRPVTNYIQQESTTLIWKILFHFSLSSLFPSSLLVPVQSITLKIVCHTAARLAETKLAGADWGLVELPAPLPPPQHTAPTTLPPLQQPSPPPPLYNPYYNLQLHCPLLILRAGVLPAGICRSGTPIENSKHISVFFSSSTKSDFWGCLL